MKATQRHPEYSMFSSSYEPKVKDLILFEAMSLLGRLTNKHRLPTAIPSPRLLHLGCGANVFEGWINADFFGGFKPWGTKKRRSQWMLDLRYPLPCACNYWDGIFIEHTLEHLQPIDALSLLRECYRVLKPNRWIRVVVPDLEKYVEYYVTGSRLHDNFGRWQTGAEAMRSLTQNWGHRSVWDGKLMSTILQEAGFDNAQKVAFGQGTDAEIIKDSPSRSWESLYVEAQATEVIGKSSS